LIGVRNYGSTAQSFGCYFIAYSFFDKGEKSVSNLEASVYTLVQDLPQLTRHGMVRWWSTAKVGRVIFWIDGIDADHETASKHFLKRLSALLDAPHFYLTIMCSLVVRSIKLIS